MRAFVLLILPVLVTACAAPMATERNYRSLDDLLSFESPGECIVGPTLETLMHSVLRDTTVEPVQIGPIEVPPEYRDSVGKPKLHLLFEGRVFESVSALNGSWLGLPIRAIAVRGYKGGDGAGFDILFDAPRGQVLKALTDAGFAPPHNGDRLANSDGIGIHMSVVDSKGAVGLRCDYD